MAKLPACRSSLFEKLNGYLAFCSVFSSFTSLSKKYGQNLKSVIGKCNVERGAKIKKFDFHRIAID